MSTKNTTPRLLAAAKEFNIGKETLIEFLSTKNFEINASNPNTKLTEEMYFALQAEFAKDKLVKKKSDEISLPKGQISEASKKSKDVSTEEVHQDEAPAKTVEKETKTSKKSKEETSKTLDEKVSIAAPKLELKVVGKLEEKKKTTKKAKEEAETIAKEETPVENTIVAPEVEIAKVTEQDSKEVKQSSTSPANEPLSPEHIETASPKVDGPNVLGKIDLDKLNQSTRPKKTTKKSEPETSTATPVESTKTTKGKAKTVEAEKVQETPKTETEKVAKAPISTIETTPKEEAPQTKEQTTTNNVETNDELEAPKVEHIQTKAPKLEGPKILGKIELPTKAESDSKEKRNRKRIPVQKKPENFKPDQRNNNQGANNTGQNRFGNNQGNTPNTNRNNNNHQGGGHRPGQNQDRNAGNNRYNNDRNKNPNYRGQNTAQQGPQEIDAKQIQKKIHETQNKLANATGGGRQLSKNQKAKYRRDKREHFAEKRAAEEHVDGQLIKLTEFISVSELANLLNVPFTEVISKCMSLGIMVSINQRLDAEIIELVASEFNYEVEFINLDQNQEEEIEEVDAEEDLQERAPIVTIMGHVDHGKTSLLDYIRKANVVAGEDGGITQHIGAYQVKTPMGKKITFLDTPGHEAFTAMRARGAKVADIAVIVVAADDAIMPQTKEAISHAQAAGLPMIFAINKIDKEGANSEKIREQLAQMNILVEDWGGKFQSQEISAKKGLNIDLLLEKILLEAELLELKANPNKSASGSVIEAALDKGRGYVTTILVQNGTLNQGEMILSGQYYGKIKAMFNERGQRVTKAEPSTPVQILGLNGAPQAGEKFKQYSDENEAKSIANHRGQILREQGIRARKHLTLDEIGRRLALGNFKELPIIIKGDFDGSVEALSDSLQKLSTEEVAVNIVHKAVGQITESDVLLATASDAIIIGFQVRPSSQASKLADQENIEIRNYSIIYDAIQDVKSAMEGLLEPKIEKKVVGNIEVREVYKIGGVGTVAGCYVLDGKMGRNNKLNIIRDGIVIYNGELSSLKRFKDDVKEVSYGYECGLMVKNYNDIRIGDIIEGYEEVETKRTL